MGKKKKKKRKPHTDRLLISTMPGALGYFSRRHRYKGRDPRFWGWDLGRQLVGQYLIEISLKSAYAKSHNDVFPHTHNLAWLFQKLPTATRLAVEKKYRMLLNSTAEWTWDVFATVEAFLKFLGKDPITETRYYWEHSRSNTLGVHEFQGLMAPEDHQRLIYALLTVLHGYPLPSLVARHKTRFESLRNAVRNKTGLALKTQGRASNMRNKEATPSMAPRLIYHMEGVLDYFQKRCPHESTDGRWIGWNIGRQVVAQYLVEVLLKCAHAQSHDDVFPHGHNLAELFSDLPGCKRRAVEEKYKELLNSEVEQTWDVFETVESFLAFLGANAITETRYYWDGRSASNTLGVDYFQGLMTPDSYRPLVYALYIVLHGYPTRPIVKCYDTSFMSLKDSLKNERRS